jgi:2-methylcitrate dehydratase PrpD
MGFHGPGLMGTFAAAGSAARTLNLSVDQCMDALGHAGQQAASLMFTHHGGMGKRMLAGQAARAGTFGALLAANGYTNAHNVFEAEYGGFPAAHTGNRHPPAYDLTQLTLGLGDVWQARGVNFKMWACRVPNHATLEAIRGLRMQHDIPADDVASLEIRLGTGAYQNVGWAYTPTTITSAQLNIYYVSALMLLENDVFVDQFTGGKIASGRVLDTISKVHVVHDPSMDENGYQGTPVRITMNDGTVYERIGRLRDPHGDDPITRADVLAKFHKMTRGFWSAATQDRAVRLCDTLDQQLDARELVALLEMEHLPPIDLGGE